jgi:hypothetical protein
MKTSKEERFCLLLLMKPCFDYLDAGVSRCSVIIRHVYREALNVRMILYKLHAHWNFEGEKLKKKFLNTSIRTVNKCVGLQKIFAK